MDYIIAIPSYNRYNLIKNQTISILEKFNIDREKVNIFVVEEEFEKYKNELPNYNIIVGVKGLINQKNFIENYFPERKNILFFDDDILEIDLDNFNTLEDLIKTGFEECNKQKSYIWSVYPVWNKYFREKREYLSNCLNFCIGGFYGIINRPNNENIKVNIYDGRDDVERSIKYFIEDGIVLRFNKVGYKTKFFANGGLGLLKDRFNDINNSVNLFLEKYPTYGKVKVRKNGIKEFVLKKIPRRDIANGVRTINIPSDKIDLRGPSDPVKSIQIAEGDTFFSLFSQLEKININYRVDKSNRLGFPKFRGCIWGISRARYSGIIGLSKYSKDHPEIYNEIVRIGKQICPFEFTSIQLNKNLVCPSHKDKKNVGESLLVSFGNYEGNNIIVDGKEYNTHCNPIIFNGSQLEHYNTPQINGTKYSLIYFTDWFAVNNKKLK